MLRQHWEGRWQGGAGCGSTIAPATLQCPALGLVPFVVAGPCDGDHSQLSSEVTAEPGHSFWLPGGTRLQHAGAGPGWAPRSMPLVSLLLCPLGLRCCGSWGSRQGPRLPQVGYSALPGRPVAISWLAGRALWSRVGGCRLWGRQALAAAAASLFITAVPGQSAPGSEPAPWCLASLTPSSRQEWGGARLGEAGPRQASCAARQAPALVLGGWRTCCPGPGAGWPACCRAVYPV